MAIILHAFNLFSSVVHVSLTKQDNCCILVQFANQAHWIHHQSFKVYNYNYNSHLVYANTQDKIVQ